MNERIKELAKKSAVWFVTPREDLLEDFAELIVQECANLNFRELGLSGSASFDVGRMIKQHFGVE